MQGQPMIVLGDESERMKDEDAQSHNISAARAVAQSVRSTLGPKGMDKMLVSSIGDVTITNDGVTILQEMDIENPTAEMIIEVAEAQEDEAGDGTTTAVAIAGELLANAEDLLEQDIHPTAIIRGFDMAVKQAREEIDDIAERVEPDDEEILKSVAETSMTGKGAELNLDLLSDLVVGAVQAVSVEGEDGSTVVDLEFIDIESKPGRPAADSTLVHGAVIDEDPTHEDMPTDVEGAEILLTDTALELDETEADAQLSVDDPSQLQEFIEQEEEQLREMVQQIADSGADVVFCQKGIDEMVEHLLAREGILAVERAKKSDIEFLREVTDARIVSDLDSLSDADLGIGDIARDEDEEWFTVESDGHGVTLLVRGSTEHVSDELERGINDALDVVAATVSDGRVLAGGGAIEVELASRLRDYADSVEGREQLAVEAFADAFELVPRVLSENAGLDPIDTLVELRSAHENGEQRAGLNVFTGDVLDTYEEGVVEPAHAKTQAISSAAEAANLVLKIDDIIQASGLGGGSGDDGPDLGGAGGAPGGMGGGMGGMM
ncbi:thermosome subunit beta [Halorhabdus rudnickae]|uniref:thermosome subunit beta n=1 Tax=Halorhabdus rudnickae TaxID=1775544 RepID=UPI00108262BB|nr:thermosome subunit beta [Halorhabdus rudnickae]